MTPSRGRALFGAAALAAAAAVWGGPGATPAAADVCSLTIDTPAAGGAIGTSTARFTGSFVAAPGPEGRTLEVSFLDAPGPRPPAVGWSDGDPGGADRYQVDVGGLSRNGTYRAQVKATHTASSAPDCQGGEADPRPTTVTAEVTFAVSVRAKPPTNVGARFEAAPRSAVVTWEKSPDPDTAGYSLSRKLGSGVFQPLRDVPADARSWTDTTLPAGPATITYAVSSSRVGPEVGTTSAPSAVVAAAPLEVPAALDTTSTSNAATERPAIRVTRSPANRNPARAGPVSPPKPFVLGRPVGGSGAPPGLDFPEGLADPAGDQPIPGDEPVLRYRPNQGDDQVQLAEDRGQAFAADRRGAGEDDTPQLAYVAAGLLSAVVAAQVLWLRSQAIRPASAAEAAEAGFPLETIVAGAASAVRARPIPRAAEADDGPVAAAVRAEPIPPAAPPAPAAMSANWGPAFAAPSAGRAEPAPAAGDADGSPVATGVRAAPSRVAWEVDDVPPPTAGRADEPPVAPAAGRAQPGPAGPEVGDVLGAPADAATRPAPPRDRSKRPVLVVRAGGKAAPARGARS